MDVDRTRESLEQLGLTHAAERLGELFTDAAKKSVPAHLFLDRLLKIEGRVREERRIKTSLRLSGSAYSDEAVHVFRAMPPMRSV